MGFEFVEAVVPHPSIGFEPVVDLDERLGTDAVEASLAVRSYADQSGVTEDAQVLRDGRLAEGQALDQGVNRLLTVAQLVEDVTTARLGAMPNSPKITACFVRFASWKERMFSTS